MEEVCEKCKPFFEVLLKEIAELKRRLLAYENAHTPPSMRRRGYPKREPTGNPVGAPQGHPGTTRPTPTPDKTIDVKQAFCEECSYPLGKPAKIMKRIIEDIPEPQPVTVTQYNVHAYLCNNCAAINIATHPDLPAEGRFGYNAQAQVAMLKYEDRLPIIKIAATLRRQHHLTITAATVLNILERVAHACKPAYANIRTAISNAHNIYADETGQKVQGKNWWTWIFTTVQHALFLIRNSRGQEPIKEILGTKYKGILNCDGWKAYYQCVQQIQRCWAHLLREAKLLAEEKGKQAKLLYKELCTMFTYINKLRPKKITQEQRIFQHGKLLLQMQQLIARNKTYQELRAFAKKIEHGREYWFTCVLHPEVEPTNNRAERGLREMVVQRKITGTLRNEKGTHRTEVLMSCIQTWKLQGLNPLAMLRQTLSS